MARRDLILTYSPRYKKLQEIQQSRSEQRTMVLATMVVLWDVLVLATIHLMIAVLLLLGLLTIAYGVVELGSWSMAQLAP